MSALIFFITLFSNIASAAQSQSIDFLRQVDGGLLHVAVRCKEDVCVLRRTLNDRAIDSVAIASTRVEKILSRAFQSIPAREIAASAPALPRIPKSPMHWRLALGGKVTQGGFLMHPSPEEEKRREPLERAVLLLEAQLTALSAR